MEGIGAEWNCKFFYCIVQPGETIEARKEAVELHASVRYTGVQLQDESSFTLADAVELVKRKVKFRAGDEISGLGRHGWVAYTDFNLSSPCQKGMVYFKVFRPQGIQEQRRSIEDIFAEWQSRHTGFIHSFANQRKLPLTSLGVTAHRDGCRPSFLLHALKDQWTKNSPVWSCIDAGVRCIPLMGVSGCGKTRIFYELLAQKWGFFWTASTARNGGSGDVSLVGEEGSGADPESVKYYAAKRRMTKLIVARLLILRYARTVIPDLTPEQWLILQTEFWRYLGDGEEDPFLELVLMLETHDLRDLLYKLWREAVEDLGCRPIFVMDEAQNLQSPNGFLSPDNLQLRPRFSPILKALLSIVLRATVCIGGTGISFLQLEESIGSAVAKDGSDWQFITDFDIWGSIDEVYQFCEKYIPGLALTKENCSRLLDKFKGRKRCLVTCLERLMLNGAWSAEVVDKFYAELTTKNATDYVMSLYAVVIQFFLSGRGTFRCRGKDLSASALVRQIVDHHLFSKSAAFALESTEADLVNWGIGWCRKLRTQGAMSEYVIDERMVMDAMVNYCRDEGHITSHLKVLMNSSKDEPSTCGFIWERVVVCHAGSIFDGSRTLDSWVKGVCWGGIFKGNATPKLLGVEGPVWRESPNATLTAYLALPGDKRPQFFMFANTSGPDIAAFASVGALHVPVLFQLKLRYAVDWEAAECTTNPEKMYGRSVRDRREYQPVMKEACRNGCISVVVAYPAAKKRSARCSLHKGSWYRLVVYLGKEEVRDLFPKELCDYLDYIKPDVPDYKDYKEYLKSGMRNKRSRVEKTHVL